MKQKLAEGLLIVVAVAVVARVVFGLLGPLLPALGVLFVMSLIGYRLLRGR